MDKGVGVGKFCRCNDFFIGGVKFSVTDVFHHGCGKQVCILQYDTERVAQVIFFDLVDVDAIVTDLTILDIVETVDQVCDRGLSGTGTSDKCDLLTRCCIEVYIVEHDLIRVITEIDIIKDYVTFQLDIIHTAVCLMGMFPCPHTGALFGFDDLPVFFSGADECNITVIYFRLFVEQFKDSLRTGKRHDNIVELHTKLVDRLAEALIIGKETCKFSKSKATYTV